MPSRLSPTAVSLVAGALLLPALLWSQSIGYRLSMPEPWSHCFEVEMTIGDLPPGESSVDLCLPAWRSGRYEIFDFAGGVVRFDAMDAKGARLPWEKVEKGKWRLAKGERTEVRVSYAVYSDDFRSRTRGLNTEHGFIDGAAVFMYVDGLRERPAELRVDPFPGWHVTTALSRRGIDRNVFSAPSYEHLADSPLEIGTHRDVSFTVLGKEHRLAIYGRYDADLDSLREMASRIVRAHAAFWGGLPYERYLFIIHAMPGGSGGTEHANSCVIGTAPFASPAPVVREDLRSVMSHEFFHVWNVKRLRPKGMNPYDWTQENYYRELWLVEGGTSYLHGRSLARHESRPLVDLNGIAAWIDAERVRPGNRVQSLAESSFDAWVKFSRRGAQAFNYETDLYGKGAIVCALMDLEIRHRSGNRRGFEEMIRSLYARFPEESEGYTLEDVEREASEAAGGSMNEFFTKYVRGTDPPDWSRFLGYAGLELSGSAAPPRPWWGAATEEEGGRLTVRNAIRGSSAYAAGLQSGDELIAIDGRRVSAATLNDRIGSYGVGDTLRLLVAREEKLREISVPLTRVLPPRAVVVKFASSTDAQRALYRSWTGTPW